MRGPAAVAVLATTLLFGASGAAGGALRAQTNGVTVELTSEPDHPRRDRKTGYTVRLTESGGTPVKGAQVTLSGRMADGMGVVVPLRAGREPGVYRGEVLFTMEGPWDLRVRVTRQGRRFDLPFKEQVAR